MQLVGMLDSPYVRRTAISLQLLGLTFEHRAVSVLRTFADFAAINPVVKAPTLVTEAGDVLMDSSLIIDYAEARTGKSLLPQDLPARTQALRQLGLALAAGEKAVQLLYEKNLRPAEKQYTPWLERVSGQLMAAVQALEAEFAAMNVSVEDLLISQAAITSAVIWQFISAQHWPLFAANSLYALDHLSTLAEATPVFVQYAPNGPGVMLIN